MKQILIFFSIFIVTINSSILSISDEEQFQAIEKALEYERNICDPSDKESRDYYNQRFQEIFQDHYGNLDPYDRYYPDYDEK